MEQFTIRELDILKDAIKVRKDTYEKYIDECNEILEKLNNIHGRKVTYAVNDLWKILKNKEGEITLKTRNDGERYIVLDMNGDDLNFTFKISEKNIDTTDGWVYNSDVKEVKLNGRYIKISEYEYGLEHINKIN